MFGESLAPISPLGRVGVYFFAPVAFVVNRQSGLAVLPVAFLATTIQQYVVPLRSEPTRSDVVFSEDAARPGVTLVPRYTS